MTAIVAMRGVDWFQLLADGAQYDPRGIVTEIKSKVQWVSNVLVTGTGAVLPQEALAETIRKSGGSIDDLPTLYPQWWPEIARQYELVIGMGGMDIVLAGWSPLLNRPRLFHAVGLADQIPDEVPGELYEVCPDAEVAFLCFGPPKAQSAAMRNVWTQPAPADFTDFATGVIEAMRREPALSAASGIRGYGVGGFIESIVMGVDCIEREIVRVWPDRPGELIRPLNANRHLH